MSGGRFLVCLWLVLAAPRVFCQGAAISESECQKLNGAAVQLYSNGRLLEADAALTNGLQRFPSGSNEVCAGLLLNNMAAISAAAGRDTEAEAFAARSVAILERHYSADDPALLHPLQLLIGAQIELKKIGRARDNLRKMQALRTDQAHDLALLHGTTAALRQAEGRYADAIPELAQAVRALEQAGDGSTAEMATLLGAMCLSYLDGHRFSEAQGAIDQALNVLSGAQEAVPMDFVRLLSYRATNSARQKKWEAAERDTREAISIASRDARLVNEAAMAKLCASEAVFLRKLHRGKEARSWERRAGASAGRGAIGIVDVTELVQAGRRSQ